MKCIIQFFKNCFIIAYIIKCNILCFKLKYNIIGSEIYFINWYLCSNFCCIEFFVHSRRIRKIVNRNYRFCFIYDKAWCFFIRNLSKLITCNNRDVINSIFTKFNWVCPCYLCCIAILNPFIIFKLISTFRKLLTIDKNINLVRIKIAFRNANIGYNRFIVILSISCHSLRIELNINIRLSIINYNLSIFIVFCFKPCLTFCNKLNISSELSLYLKWCFIIGLSVVIYRCFYIIEYNIFTNLIFCVKLSASFGY